MCIKLVTVGSALQRLEEVPQLDSRKLPETLLNLALVARKREGLPHGL